MYIFLTRKSIDC